MKKNILIVTLSMLALLLVAGCNSSAPAKSVAVIDAAKVFNESKNAQAVMKHLEEYSKSLQEEVQNAQKALEKEQSEANNKTFHDALTKYQTAIQGEQQRVVKLVEDRFQGVLDDFRKAEGYAIILPKDVVLSMDESGADVTDKIMEKMDAEMIDFSAK